MSIVRKSDVRGEVEIPTCEKCGNPLELGSTKPIFKSFHEGAEKLPNGLIRKIPIAHEYWFSPCAHCMPPHIVIKRLSSDCASQASH